MSTAKKLNPNPESYIPNERPEIVSLAEKVASAKKYQEYKDIEYRMDIILLPESLKLAGVTSENNPNFQNIEKYHNEFKAIMRDRHTPYTEIGISGNMTNQNGDYIFGCQVDSVDNLPNGLISFDTGLKKFASITFRAKTAYDLVGGADGPGDGMKTAGEYIKEVWLPENMDAVYNVNLEHMFFDIKTEDKDYCLFMIEVYKVELTDEPEMCFYIPLKP
jgi:hypothetical protein